MTSKIAEIFNENRPEKEKWKNRSIGWKMRELGFISHRTNQGHGWIIPPDRLEYWKQIYGVSQNGKLSLQKNGTNGTNGTTKCWLCNKPIIKDTLITFLGGKPVHLSCGKQYKTEGEN